ncbi:MAG: hypothetical protein ACREMB_18780 [Candidatus Rokuibacteriota bacterium]
MMRQMPGFKELRQQRRMSWIAQQHGWVAVPEEIVSVLSNEGFEEECKRETTTSRRDRHPAGDLWQGVNTRTGSVASATWVNRPAWHYSLVFIEVDGESLADGPGRASRAVTPPRGERDPYQDEGGEGQALDLPRARPPTGEENGEPANR